MNLTFIHDLCYVSYYFEVIKGFKRSVYMSVGMIACTCSFVDAYE